MMPDPLSRSAVAQAALLGSAAALCLACLARPAAAQIIPTGSPAADILLTQAIAEQRVFLTCSSLDAVSHGYVVQGWDRDVASAIATLTRNNVVPEAIAAFSDAARLETLLPAPDTPYSEVRQLCDAHPDWQTTYGRLDWTILELKLPKVFE
jgi:hypothetical protein